VVLPDHCILSQATALLEYMPQHASMYSDNVVTWINIPYYMR